MRNKEEKIARAAHIKRHTAGTSNEISLSVLDAVKNAQDGDIHTAQPGIVSLFTLNRVKKPAPTPTKERELTLSSDAPISVSSPSPSPVSVSAPESDKSSWKTPVEEVARRKAQRKRRQRIAIATIVVGVVALVAMGATTLYSGYQAQINKQEQLISLIRQIEIADQALLPLDELIQQTMESPLDELSADEVNNRLNQIEAINQQLQETKSAIENLQPNLNSTNDAEAANRALEAINARMNMLYSGKDLLAAASAAAAAYQQADDGWSVLIEADTAARDAAALVENTTAENVQASMERSNAAISSFTRARNLLAAAQNAYGVDLSAFVDYANLRIEAQLQALASDQAYIDRDKEMAAKANDAYNEKDSEAVELIKKQDGATPQQLIEEAYEQAVEGTVASYGTERSRAADADAFLRDYLGSHSK